MHRPKRKTKELQMLATQILMTSGADISQAVAIRPLAKAMVRISGCSYPSAVRHLERAILRAQEELKPPQ
jgi:hypothetical protein